MGQVMDKEYDIKVMLIGHRVKCLYCIYRSATSESLGVLCYYLG